MSALTGGGELAACAAMVRHARQLFASGHGSRLTWALGCFALLFSIFALVGSPRTFLSMMSAAAMCIGFLILAWWLVLFNSLAKQTARSGALVPGIRRRSIKVLALAWLAAVACATAPFVVAGLSAPVVVVVVALILSITALLTVRPVVGALFLAASYAPGVIRAFLMPVDDDLVMAIRLLLGVAAAGLAIHALLTGKSTIALARVRMQYDPKQQAGRATATYAGALKRDIASGDRAALLLHCLGPVAALTLLMPALLFVLIIGLAFALSLAAPSLVTLYQVGTQVHVGLPMGLVSVLLSQLYMVVTSVRNTASEQSLVMLTARRPASAAINRVLARALVLRYCVIWLMLTSMLLIVSAIFGAGAAGLTWLLAILLITLTAGSLLLQNYALADRSKPVLPILLGLGAIATLSAAAMGHESLATGSAFVATWLATALLCYVLRWKAMLRAPVAFPARRLT